VSNQTLLRVQINFFFLQVFKRKVQLISFFAAMNDFLRCLELRFDWGLKTQQIEGVVLAWLSRKNAQHIDIFKSLQRRCHKKSAHSSMKSPRGQKEEKQSIENKKDRQRTWNSNTTLKQI